MDPPSRRKSLNGSGGVAVLASQPSVNGDAGVVASGAAPVAAADHNGSGVAEVKVTMARPMSGGGHAHSHRHAHSHGGSSASDVDSDYSDRRGGPGGPPRRPRSASDDVREAQWVARNKYRIRPFMVCVGLILALGLSLFITGIFLRLEKPPRTLYTAVNLCYDSNFKIPTFFGSGTLCYSEESSVQTMSLSEESLVSDVDYVAFVVFPSGSDVNGSITLSLNYQERPLFTVTQNLHAIPAQHRHHFMSTRHFLKGQIVPMYTEFPSVHQLNDHCNDPRIGCLHTLQYDMDSFVLVESRFRIPSASILHRDGQSDVDLPPHVQLFAPNLTIAFTDVWLKGTSLAAGAQTDDPSAQMFVGFYQYDLSYVQHQGVASIVAGVFVLALGVGLALAPCCGGRPPKLKHRRS